jgi:hypothetical protein
MKSCDLSLMVFRCFRAHFRVPMKGHEKTYHKCDKSQEVLIVKRQIINNFMFVKNLQWLIYGTLVQKALKNILCRLNNPQ